MTPTGTGHGDHLCGMGSPAQAAVTEQTGAIIVAAEVALLCKVGAGAMFHGVAHHGFDEDATRAQLKALCDTLHGCIGMVRAAPEPTGQLAGLNGETVDALDRLHDAIAGIGTELAFTADVPEDFHDRIDAPIERLLRVSRRVSAALVLADTGN